MHIKLNQCEIPYCDCIVGYLGTYCIYELSHKTLFQISSERSESGHDMLTDLGYMLEEKQAKRVEDEDEKRSRTERIAIFSPGVNPSDIRVPDSMKGTN